MSEARKHFLLSFFMFLAPARVFIPFSTVCRVYGVDGALYRYLDAYVFGIRVARINLFGWVDKQ